MGNYVSCALTKTSTSSSAARVILPDGEVRYIHAPMKAAELMMEIPSFFLVDANSLKTGRKFDPLAADDDLHIKGCHVYVAFPMARATSAANASDMARLIVAAKKQQLHRRRRRVSPDALKMITPPSNLNLDDITEFSAAEFMHRISVSKSKKPKLETIAEESLS